MNSLIYNGEVSHVRHTPTRHHFSYPVYFYAFDIDELEALDRSIALFGYNRLRPVAIHDRDYLDPNDRPLREKLNTALQRCGIGQTPQRVVLVTAARYFNYVFNPVSFFYCYDHRDELICVLAQVNNTFGEMHLYLLKAGDCLDGETQWDHPKEFHVSPFFTRDGAYRFTLSPPQQHLDNRIEYRLSDQPQLTARLSGTAQPLTASNLLKVLLRHPISASLTMPRILWQAARLYWQRRLPVYTRPIPDHPMTVRTVPEKALDRLGHWLFRAYLSRLQHGRIEVTLPDGRVERFGPDDDKPADLHVRDNSFFRRVLCSGDIGFGEAYTAGAWRSEDLPRLLTLLAEQEHILNDRSLLLTWGGRIYNYFKHLLRANTLSGAARNISAHYDLSNRFFALFLDPSMSYSCAHYTRPGQTLDQAQQTKMQRIIDLADIGPEDHVLEIGCGWGALAIETVRRTGCHVTGITLSREQLALARDRVAAAGLSDRIDLQLCDYRTMTGRFTRIVSVEMLEAVGHRGLFTFFATCDRLLAPGGRMVVQVITIPDDRYNAYRFGSDWIRKYIFPGGHLPSPGVLRRAVSRRSSLVWDHSEWRGADYARTLASWRTNLLARRDDLLKMGYDEPFVRSWDYYFSYCQAGFSAGIIDLLVMALNKPAAPTEPT